MKVRDTLSRKVGGLPPFPLLFGAILILAAMLLPLTYLLIHTSSAGEKALSLLTHKRTVQVFVNSLFLALAVTTFSAMIAVPLAFLTVRTDLPARRFWSVATILPLAIPSYVGSFALISALAPRGSIIQNLLSPLGVEQLPSIYGFPGAVLSLTLFTYPYILLSVRSALYGLDPALEEVAQSLGYARRETFLRVVLPLLKPSIAAGTLLVALYSLSDFGTPSLMRFDSFTRVIYIQYQSTFDRSMAAVLSVLLVMVAALLVYLEQRVRRVSYYSTSAGVRRKPKLIALGKWRWIALAFCISVVGLALILPLSVIAYWLIRGVMAGEAFNSIFHLALNSALVSSLAALAVIPAALIVAVIAVRYPSPLSKLIEQSTYIGFAMPGIVVALSLVFFGAGTPLYQSMAMLIFAYMVLFIPQAVGTVRSSLLQLNPRMEEAARSLGSNAWQTLRLVVVPLTRPGILTGSALVFLSTMKELPATLLLAPIGFSTLATRVWSATEDVFFAQAAAASVLLIAVSALTIVIILSQEPKWKGE
ncbi:ABC transporter permease [Candidatus Pyrohabitans sp.]